MQSVFCFSTDLTMLFLRALIWSEKVNLTSETIPRFSALLADLTMQLSLNLLARTQILTPLISEVTEHFD